MDNKKRIMVKNETKGLVSISVPDLRFKREWVNRGAVRPINFEELEQIMYEPGVEYMFRQGILSIEDKEARIALGFEGEEAIEPVIVLTDAQKENYLKNKPITEFRQSLKSLPKEQVDLLVEYAIDHEIIHVEKCEILKTMTGVDIVKAVQLQRQAKEA